jgi:uncharacterized phage-associated protein
MFFFGIEVAKYIFSKQKSEPQIRKLKMQNKMFYFIYNKKLKQYKQKKLQTMFEAFVLKAAPKLRS